MVFILPLIFGALGVAVGAVASAFTSHAIGESDREAAKHHKTIANELVEKYAALEKRYNELADESKRQILDLTRQHALDEVEKDCLRLAVRLQKKLIDLMLDIDREPKEVTLKKFVEAVEVTNSVLYQIHEELVIIPSDYYARNLIAAVKSQNLLKQSNVCNDLFLSVVMTDGDLSKERNIEKDKQEKLIMKDNEQNMSSQKFQETYYKISEAGNRLLNYLQEIRDRRLQEGDMTQGLQSIEEDVKTALEALIEQKYRVAVIAAMKAGKSTFLNAIIGADVLASEAEACTVCRTDIRPIPVTQTPKLLEYREGQQQSFIVAEGEAAELRQKFLKRTHEIRATANRDKITRFELEHPIEAIETLSSLTGFTLVDTPGPNEWESANFNTVALKQTALEALRTCNAILFILDYTSFQDNTNAELLQDLIEQRKEFLLQSKEKIFFILNKVDRRSERDKSISSVIEDLKDTLIGFGIPEPTIYPVSAWQGLLAKLIQQKKANDSDIKDFENCIGTKFIETDERGRRYLPLPEVIAPPALRDSGLLTIQEKVLQTIIQNSGWNLLSEVLAIFNKAAQSLDTIFMTETRSWEEDFEQLEKTIEEYKKRSNAARTKVASVKKSVEEQKKILIIEFSKGIHLFAETAKQRIETEIEKVARNRSKSSLSREPEKNLLTSLWNKLGSWLEGSSGSDPFRIQVKTKKEAEEINKTINEYCSPVIHSFWLDTQDKLVRNGEKIRQELVWKIQENIQAISNELSEYLGEALKVELGTNQIQFPEFKFSGIDTKIQARQEAITRIRKEKRTKSRPCKSDKIYEVEVPYQETVIYHEIDLRLTLQTIKNKIEEQVKNSITAIQIIVHKQVSEDFREGEKQINDYINRFQSQFDSILKRRAFEEVKAPEIIATLEKQRIEVNEYLNDLEYIRTILNTLKSSSFEVIEYPNLTATSICKHTKTII